MDRLPEILELDQKLPEERSRLYQLPTTQLRYRNPGIRIAGFGGQGLLYLGKVMAEAGMRTGYHVSWMPSYGPEMRGGTANCHVYLSNEPIGSPLVTEPSILIALNLPSLERFEKDVRPGGLIIYDSSLIEHAPRRRDIEVIALPATSLAVKAGNAHAANMVALGAILSQTGLLAREGVLDLLGEMTTDADRLAINSRAFDAGWQFAPAGPLGEAGEAGRNDVSTVFSN